MEYPPVVPSPVAPLELRGPNLEKLLCAMFPDCFLPSKTSAVLAGFSLLGQVTKSARMCTFASDHIHEFSFPRPCGAKQKIPIDSEVCMIDFINHQLNFIIPLCANLN